MPASRLSRLSAQTSVIKPIATARARPKVVHIHARMPGPLQQVVAHDPFFPAAIGEQLLAGHEEHPPASHPAFRLGAAVDLDEQLVDRIRLGVEPLQPGPQRPGVVPAVDHPAVADGQVPGKTAQQVERGHHPAGEEVPRHPVVFSVELEEVGEVGGGRRCARRACPPGGARRRPSPAGSRSSACARTSPPRRRGRNGVRCRSRSCPP